VTNRLLVINRVIADAVMVLLFYDMHDVTRLSLTTCANIPTAT